MVPESHHSSLFSSPVADPRTGGGPLRFARVVLERGIDNPDGLTYAIPSDLPDLRIGDRVGAPLGRGDRLAHGYVIDVSSDPGDVPPSRIKPLSNRTAGAMPPALIQLARWLSLYYCCPIGMVLAAMLPAAVKRETGRITRTLLQPTTLALPEKLPPKARTLAEAIAAGRVGPFPASPKDIAHRAGLRTIGPVNQLKRLGLLEEIVSSGVRSRGFEPATSAPEACAVELTRPQHSAVRSVVETLGTFCPHVVHGVTGSGKTEVYLGILEEVLRSGHAAIVLVPEISLTPQTAGRFVRRFGSHVVAVLHSGLTASQRHREWDRLARGEAKVVVGARSAIFAPLTNLGVVIVDEEHDSSYKQDQLPRYHARDVALKRGQIESCPVVLGSATPSLESWRNAQRGKFRLIELKDRVGGGKLPKVEIVDMIEERRNRLTERRELHALGPTLERAIARTLDEGGQLILLLNRRGFASYIACPDQGCGWVQVCDHCDITMVQHRSSTLPGGILRCHHCLAEQKMPELCPACGKRISAFGFGTQRLEIEIGRKFPSLVLGQTMLRIDSDTMQRAADYHSALGRFASGEIRALLGTQMIAKGLDFPGVSLIGVVNADTGLDLPDFRASERTFQLVSQVSGRAGRSAQTAGSSRVVVQTMNPHEPAIRLAAAHNFRGFAEQELLLRTAVGLPPVGRMARIVFRDTDAAKADAAAWTAVHAMQEVESPHLRIKGPMPCPISRIAGYYRVAVELLAKDAPTIQSVLTHVRNLGLVKSDAHTAVDVDPIALL